MGQLRSATAPTATSASTRSTGLFTSRGFMTSVADPDPGWVKSQDQDPGSGSGMNNPDHIS